MGELRADYGAAKHSRFRRHRNLPVNGAGADYHVRNQTEYFRLVEFARDMEHNAPLVRQGLRRLVANCNPGQMTPDPATGDREVDQHLMKRWWAWSEAPKRCHAAKKLGFRRMTNVAFTRVVVDGDCFGLPLLAGSIQTLEADRCRTPNRARTRGGVCGVEKTELGAPLRYWMTKRPYDGVNSITFDDVQEFAAFTPEGEPNVYHVYNPERFSQSRGVTALAPVLDSESIRDDLEFAQLIKNQVSAAHVFSEVLDPTAWQFLDSLGALERLKADAGEYFLDQWGNGAERKTVGIRPGQILPARVPGLSYEMFHADIPGAGFFELEKTVLTYLAINLDLPLIVFLLDASDTTFSSYRHVLEQSRLVYQEILDWFSLQWHRPIWRWQVMRWLEEGDAVLQGFMRKFGNAEEGMEALLQHDWVGQSSRYIEPVKDKTGDAIELSHSLTSRRRWARARCGIDWETLAGEVVQDNALAIKLAITAAQKLETETGVAVDWRELLPFGMPTGVTMSLSATAEGESDDQEPADAGDDGEDSVERSALSVEETLVAGRSTLNAQRLNGAARVA